MISHKSLFLLTMMKTKPVAIRKKKRTCVKSLQQRQAEPEFEFYLPGDCWVHVFTFLIDPVYGIDKLSFNSLSLVSKHFLSITNRLIFSLKIYYPQFCFLPRCFHRFPNLNSLDLRFASHHLHLDAGIPLALRDRPSLNSLCISWLALRDRPSLNSLSIAKCVTSHCIDSLLSLKGLSCLKFRSSQISDDLLYSIAREGLPLKSLVLENCIGYSYHGIYDLLSKCCTIRHLGLQGNDFLNNRHVSKLFLLLPDLVSINLSKCSKLTESALFALIKNCHSLGEITMESIWIGDFTMEHIYIYIEREGIENYDILKNFDVNPQLKSLHLAHTSFINDETIILFASVFPNWQLLDLSYCFGISKKGICQILSRCCKVRHLDLTHLDEVRGLKMNFIVHQLEVLELFLTNVDDKTLYEISKSCRRLKVIDLSSCKYITEKGVMCVIENCTRLKEIDLSHCDKVNVDVVSMLSSRPLVQKYNAIYFL